MRVASCVALALLTLIVGLVQWLDIASSHDIITMALMQATDDTPPAQQQEHEEDDKISPFSPPPPLISATSKLAVAARNTERELHCTFGQYGTSNPNVSNWVRFNSSAPLLPYPKIKPSYFACPQRCDTSIGWKAPKQCPIRGLKGQCQDTKSAEHGCELSLYALCEAMQGRELLFFGDSTTERIYWTFLLQLARQLNITATRHKTVLCHKFSPHPDFHVTYKRNDFLLIEREDITRAKKRTAVTRPYRADKYYEFKHDLRNDSVIFLNRGLHFENNDFVLPELKNLFSYLQVNFPQAALFYWFSPMPVHPELYSNKPSSSYLPPMPSKNHDLYDWLNLEPQNHEIAGLLSKSFPQVVQIDLIHMTKFRGDCRGDALHSCIPGFADWQSMHFVHAVIKHTLEINAK